MCVQPGLPAHAAVLFLFISGDASSLFPPSGLHRHHSSEGAKMSAGMKSNLAGAVGEDLRQELQGFTTSVPTAAQALGLSRSLCLSRRAPGRTARDQIGWDNSGIGPAASPDARLTRKLGGLTWTSISKTPSTARLSCSRRSLRRREMHHLVFGSIKRIRKRRKSFAACSKRQSRTQLKHRHPTATMRSPFGIDKFEPSPEQTQVMLQLHLIESGAYALIAMRYMERERRARRHLPSGFSREDPDELEFARYAVIATTKRHSFRGFHLMNSRGKSPPGAWTSPASRPRNAGCPKVGVPNAMPRQARPFTQSDISRALKGAKAAGLCVSRVKILPDGSIELVSAIDTIEPLSSLDIWRAAKNARATV